MEVLEASALQAGYRDRPVLREVTFSVGRGELWAILGPNGAGKSTLLRTCMGLLSMQAGRISILGKSIEQWSRRELAQRMAWVPQSFDSGAGFTGLELVLMGRSPHLGLWGLPSRADVDHALALMRDLQIEQLASRASDALSGGERRLLLLARALAQEPLILLLDEPTAFLDLKHQVDVLRRIKAQTKGGLSAMAVVHDVNHAMAFADKVLLIKDGVMLACGSPSSTLTAQVLERLFDLPITSADAGEGQKFFAPRFTQLR
jgi:iron complex transport system ATP-binding protein